MSYMPQWICFPVSHVASAHDFEPEVDQWIWHPKEHNFNRDFRIADLADVCNATILVSVDEGYTLFLNGKEINRSDGKIFSWSRPARISIMDHIQLGNNQLRIEAYNTYLEKPGAVLSLKLGYFDGSVQNIRTDATWVTDSGKHVGIVARMGEMPWRVPSADVSSLPVVHFRKQFRLEQPLHDVKLKLSALGIVEARVDGARPKEHPELLPGWTDYNKIVPKYELDVGSLEAGLHEIELMLASGWYAGYLGWERGRGYYGENPAVYAELLSGDDIILTTDATWLAGMGPWLEADLLMGVRYDSRIQTDFNFYAKIFDGFVPEMVSADWEPVRIVGTQEPISITKTMHGSYIVDFGRIIAGFVSLRLTEAAGSAIWIRHAEVLKADGTLYFDNIRMARAEDMYISSGQEDETFRPFFTYHGFRFAEITGLNSTPNSESLQAHRIKSDVPRVGTFTCDNELINKIYNCYIASSECTLVDIPTDCAQRDERLGWTGDGSILSEAHMQTFDVSRFYSKLLLDLFHSQREDGALPDIAPYVKFGSGTIGWNNAAWSDAAVWVTSQLVREYGTLDVATKNWENLKKYAESLWMASENGYREGGSYGDWLNVNAPTPLDFIATTFHAIVNQEMVFLCGQLGHVQESTRYSDRLLLIKQVLDQRFAADDEQIQNFTQTACVLMLRFGLLSDEKMKRCANVLVEDIHARDISLSTGFLGTPWLLDVLSEIGRSDLAAQLLKKETFPSWGFMVKNGATALWEHWDSYTPENGFKDPVMNSFSHASLGGFAFWFYKRAGWIHRIDSETRTIYIRPDVAPYLSHVSVSRITRLGKVSVDWKAGVEGISAKIYIPPDTKAVLELESRQTVGSGIHHINIPYSKYKKHGNY
jgi:alpha-L-rhamnosidase